MCTHPNRNMPKTLKPDFFLCQKQSENQIKCYLWKFFIYIELVPKFWTFFAACKTRVLWCLDFVKSHSWPHHQSQLKSNLMIGEKRFEFLGQCIHKQSLMSTHTGALLRPGGYIFRFTTLCDLIHTVCQDTYSYLFFRVAWQCLHLHRLPQSSAPSA